MDFDFTDDQESLRDAVRRWVDKGFSFERRHAIAKAGGVFIPVNFRLVGHEVEYILNFSEAQIVFVDWSMILWSKALIFILILCLGSSLSLATGCVLFFSLLSGMQLLRPEWECARKGRVSHSFLKIYLLRYLNFF